MATNSDSARQQEYLKHSITVKTQIGWTDLRHESQLGDTI